MYLDLMDVLRAPGSMIERPIDLEPTNLDDIELTARLKGAVRATNARRNLVIIGHAQTSVRMNCARCLREYSQPLELELEASAPLSFFRARISSAIGTALPEKSDSDEDDQPDDETAAIFDAHSVDVLELIRQAIVLQWPIQPLCSTDCPGLPEATTYHAGDDPRWGALRNWQVDEQGGEESQN